MLISEFLIIFAAILAASALLSYTVKRIRLLYVIHRLKRIDGVTVEICSYPSFFAPRPTRRIAARISVGGRCYAVRIFNGVSGAHSVHLASPKFASVSIKSASVTKARIFGRQVSAVKLEGGATHFARTVIMKPEGDREGDVPVMLFNPAPRELTYVTPEKNSIRVAFTGDTVMGMRIFTRSTFENFIDRSSRGFYT
ncbi:MAG: hypothetical protein E7617_05440 [Ruminococcaceae bacterium]|nr:hypothetical protein [Oscillospiraceae bacterium]